MRKQAFLCSAGAGSSLFLKDTFPQLRASLLLPHFRGLMLASSAIIPVCQRRLSETVDKVRYFFMLLVMTGILK